MTHPPRVLGATLAGLVLAFSLAGCGDDGERRAAGGDPGDTVTLYNAQHEDLMKEMTAAFTEETGIEVEMRSGDDLEMANQIVQEGDASPADVFVTENSPAMTLVDSKGRFAPVSRTALDQVPARYRPSDGHWVGFAARQTTFAYNTEALPRDDLPASIMDLAEPKWKGRFGYSPTGADFQAIVSAVVALEGDAAGQRWLDGLKRNARAYDGNTKVMAAVNKGDIDGGVIYHYYWYKDQAESGADSDSTKLHFFEGGDPGAFTSVSGAGVLKSAKHAESAQKLVAFLTGASGQRVLADSTALEYTVAAGVPANDALEPLSTFDAPDVDLTSLNSEKVVGMMQEAGIL
jgi:iron(III) transport system substrate-binding protein